MFLLSLCRQLTWDWGGQRGEEWMEEWCWAGWGGGGMWEEGGRIRSNLAGRGGAEGTVEVVEVLWGVGCIVMDNLAVKGCGAGLWKVGVFEGSTAGTGRWEGWGILGGSRDAEGVWFWSNWANGKLNINVAHTLKNRKTHTHFFYAHSHKNIYITNCYVGE